MSDYGLISSPYVEKSAAYREPTMREKLELAVTNAEKRLTDAKRAKEIFDAHPELEELLNILHRNGNF